MPLTASRCPNCGQVAYPSESICNTCGHRGTSEPVEVSHEGTLYTFTIVHAAAPGVATPYALGYVDFAEGARAFGRIVSGEKLAVGMRVEVVVPDDNRDTFWFVPVGESERVE